MDCKIWAPGQENNMVDSVNTYDKHYLMIKCVWLVTSNVDGNNSRINSHSMVEKSSYSLANKYNFIQQQKSSSGSRYIVNFKKGKQILK